MSFLLKNHSLVAKSAAKVVPKERKAYSNAFLGQVKCYLKTRGWIVFGCTWMSMYSARVWCLHGIMYGGRVWCVCAEGMCTA